MNRRRPELGDRTRPAAADRAAGQEAARRLAELRVLAASWGFPLHGVADRLALRIEEVAGVTGLSASLVRALVRDGELPAVKVRTVPLVLVADLVAFLERHRQDRGAEADRIAAELEASLRDGRG